MNLGCPKKEIIKIDLISWELGVIQIVSQPDLRRIYIQGYYIPDIYPIQGYIRDIYIQKQNVIYDMI